MGWLCFLMISKLLPRSLDEENTKNDLYLDINAKELDVDVEQDIEEFSRKSSDAPEDTNEDVLSQDNIALLKGLKISEDTLSYRQRRYDSYQETMLQV